MYVRNHSYINVSFVLLLGFDLPVDVVAAAALRDARPLAIWNHGHRH